MPNQQFQQVPNGAPMMMQGQQMTMGSAPMPMMGYQQPRNQAGMHTQQMAPQNQQMNQQMYNQQYNMMQQRIVHPPNGQQTRQGGMPQNQGMPNQQQGMPNQQQGFQQQGMASSQGMRMAPQRMPQKPPVKMSRQQHALSAMNKSPDSADLTLAKPVQVLSGDSIEVKAFISNDAGERNWEPRILTIDGIIAPKTARGQRGDESAFGWESKDFLRSQLMFSLRPKFLAFTEIKRDGAASAAGAFVRSQGKEIRRVFCKICILDDETGNPERNVDLAEMMVKNGWCEVKLRRNEENLSEYFVKLKELQESAETGKLGMHSIEATDPAWADKTRAVDWILNRRDNRDKAIEFYEMAKGRELDAVVDSIREGAMVHLEVIPDDKMADKVHRMCFVNLFGIKSPLIPLNFDTAKQLYDERQKAGKTGKWGPPKRGDHDPEKYAKQAREHTELRLLGMKVKIRLEFCDDRGNLYGQVFLVHMGKKLDIAPSLVHKGLAVVVPWQAGKMKNQGKDLFAAQNKAKASKLNIWSLPDPNLGCPSLKSLINASDTSVLTGRVVNVRSGDSVHIKITSTGEIKEYFLASVRAYRYGFGPMDAMPTGGRQQNQEAWKRMAAAREFVRELTIAKDKEVKIEEEYTRSVNVTRRGKGGKAEEMKEERKYATLLVGPQGKEINIGVELCKAGLAENLSYDIKNQERSKHFAALLDATNEAKKEKKGYHNEDFVEDKFLDLTIRPRKGAGQGASNPTFQAVSEQLWKCGLKGQTFPAQVEYVFTGHKVKVIIDDHKIFKQKKDIDVLKSGVLGKSYCRHKAISVFLEGVRCKPSDQGDLTGYGSQAKQMVTDLVNQRTVFVTINQFRRNNFLGTVQFQSSGRGKRKNLSEELVKCGLAEVMSFLQYPGIDKLLKLQSQAQEARLNIWANYQPEVQEAEAEKEEDTMKDVKEFKGTVTHVESGSSIFVCPDGSADAQAITTELNNVKDAAPPTAVKRGEVYAGQFGNEFYRCKVERQSPADKSIIVNFIDFGNHFKLKQDQLRPLAGEIKDKAPLAKKVTLAYLVPPPKTDNSTFMRSGQKISQLVMNQRVRVNILKRERHKPPHVEVLQEANGRSVNEEMAELGLLKFDERQTKHIKKSDTEQFKYKCQLQEKTRLARIKRMGIYQFGDPDASDEEGEMY